MSQLSRYRPYHPAWWVLRGIKAYQKMASPALGPNCRFLPTCSEYGAVAIDRHGLVRGSGMTVRRVGRCHPFHEGGFDPVPPRRDEILEEVP